MCATYTLNIDLGQFSELFESVLLDESSPLDRVKSDVYPFGYAPVLVRAPHSSDLLLTAKRYALTPPWAKEEKVKWATYNARMTRSNAKSGKYEFIYEVPTWKSAFAKNHCVVPLNNFRESCHDGKAHGHIAQFSSKNQPLLFAAGIYDDWVNAKTGEVISSFAIITTEPDRFLTEVGHDRSPVFLDKGAAYRWLEPFKTSREAFEFLEKNTVHPHLDYELVRKLKSAAGSEVSSLGSKRSQE